MILGIETSCDESSAAIVRKKPGSTSCTPLLEVLGLATFSQIAIHAPYGGVVPEIASRNHLETIQSMIQEALKMAEIQAEDLEAIAVTNRPGLIGSLLVGVSAAKAFAYTLEKPLIPIHHLEGHAVSIFLQEKNTIGENPPFLKFPLLLAIISGGHTHLYCLQNPPESWPLDVLEKSLIGQSLDDSAGEAFDKTSKMLGFSYPGGIWIDRISENGDPKAFSLPRALAQKNNLNFSFSGLKTAVFLLIEKLKKQGPLEPLLPDLCASIQEAIVDAILKKVLLAYEGYSCQSLAIVGGVAANRRLQARLKSEWERLQFSGTPFFPPLSYCTDNAAMIAGSGVFRFQQGMFLKREEFLTLSASPRASLGKRPQ